MIQLIINKKKKGAIKLAINCKLIMTNTIKYIYNNIAILNISRTFKIIRTCNCTLKLVDCRIAGSVSSQRAGEGFERRSVFSWEGKTCAFRSIVSWPWSKMELNQQSSRYRCAFRAILMPLGFFSCRDVPWTQILSDGKSLCFNILHGNYDHTD